jgi:hypothetical protein
MTVQDDALETAKQLQANELMVILADHKDKRVIALAATCTGKTTLQEHIPGAQDIDKLVFPLLSKAEADYVNHTPWTPEIGEAMSRLTKERVKVEAGKPVFGTVVLEADLVILLKISDYLLRERTLARGLSFDDAKNMQQYIEAEIDKSGLPVIEFSMG